MFFFNIFSTLSLLPKTWGVIIYTIQYCFPNIHLSNVLGASFSVSVSFSLKVSRCRRCMFFLFLREENPQTASALLQSTIGRFSSLQSVFLLSISQLWLCFFFCLFKSLYNRTTKEDVEQWGPFSCWIRKKANDSSFQLAISKWKCQVFLEKRFSYSI